MPILPQVVLVTGASRGYGRLTARHLAERGHHVIATMRNPDRDGPAVVQGYEPHITAAHCDVTNRGCVDAAVALALARHGRLDAVVNNAGVLMAGAIEDFSDEEVDWAMNTNVLGPLRVIQAALPVMRQQGGGKIINVSSLAGMIGGPVLGIYCATKHALEAISEALRYEVARWGIQVALVESGAYHSEMQFSGTRRTAALLEGRSLYQQPCKALLEGEQERARNRPQGYSIAATVADIVELQDPIMLRWPVGDDTHRVMALRRRMTDDEFEAMLRGMRNLGFPGSFFAAEEALIRTAPAK